MLYIRKRQRQKWQVLQQQCNVSISQRYRTKGRMSTKQRRLVCSGRVLMHMDAAHRSTFCHATGNLFKTQLSEGFVSPHVNQLGFEHESRCVTLPLCLHCVQCRLSEIGWCREECQLHTHHDWANTAPQAVLCSWMQMQPRAIAGI